MFRYPRKRNALALRRVAIAAACCATSLVAHAAIGTSGDVVMAPAPVPIGPGDTVLPTTALWVGQPGVGTLQVDGGSFLQLARLSFGSGGLGNGTGLVTGAGTRVELVTDGSVFRDRLLIGEWGDGSLTVSAGAVLEGPRDPGCWQAGRGCGTFVGSAAGDTGSLLVTGAGSRVSMAGEFFVAEPSLATQAVDGYTFGNPGGTTRGTVRVTDGATLATERVQLAPRHWSASSTRTEFGIGEISVSGAGSRWLVSDGPGWDGSSSSVINFGADVLTANDANSLARINITDGGVMHIESSEASYAMVRLTTGGGRTDAVVSGAGSKMEFGGTNNYLHVGSRTGGTATLSVLAGGAVDGVYSLDVGRNMTLGTLVVDGAASRVSVNQHYVDVANARAYAPVARVGNSGGVGRVTVSNGGLLEVQGGPAALGSPSLLLGDSAASNGALAITGTGSMVVLNQQSVLEGGGPGENANPFMRVGRYGQGSLDITLGGQLLLQGNAISTAADQRSTSLYIGGSGADSVGGGKGVAVVSGAGSAIKVQGSDAYIAVGIGPGASGQLAIKDQGTVEATVMNVGRNAVGVLSMDGGAMNLMGQYSGGGLYGAALTIGSRGGVGVASLLNGSVVTLSNLGSAGVSLNLGGTVPNPLGDGSLTLDGASRITLVAAPGLATVSIGDDGSGVLRLKGASTLDAGDGNFFVGRLSGSDGTVIATGGSAISAGWVGVGRDRTASGSVDGGTGTMVLNGATLTADTVVIGTNGFLGGTAGSINAGNVINYGIFSPGNSPGLFTINGNYTAGAGSRLILEVQADGNGGFLTDQVLFGAAGALDLASLNVEFRFLGGTDPNAFQSSGGFNIDQFLGLKAANGDITVIDDSVFSQTHFTAQADAYVITEFSFTAAGGATFVARPVPEPGGWSLMLAGGAALIALTRRRGVRPAGAA
jgi:T5SS/PEP-CTERM-associated repeat protein